MRRILIALTIAAMASVTSLAQTRVHKLTERAIVALEKRAFDAWIKKDRKFFEQNMWSDGQFLAADGVGAKAQYIKAIIENNCMVTRYALDNTKVTMLSSDSALLTYRYTHDAVCGGNPEASPIWASTIYVKRNAKWLIAFHQEVPAVQSK